MAYTHLYTGEYAPHVVPYCGHGRFGANLVKIQHTVADLREVTCELCKSRMAGAAYRAIHGDPDTPAKPGPDGDPRPLGDDAA